MKRMRLFVLLALFIGFATWAPSALAASSPDGASPTTIEDLSSTVFVPGVDSGAGEPLDDGGTTELRPRVVINSECKELHGDTSCFWVQNSECASFSCYVGGGLGG